MRRRWALADVTYCSQTPWNHSATCTCPGVPAQKGSRFADRATRCSRRRRPRLSRGLNAACPRGASSPRTERSSIAISMLLVVGRRARAPVGVVMVRPVSPSTRQGIHA
jgi:hypothetical protein